MKPLCIDLFCGLGGWTEGFLEEDWDVIGFDIEQHVYGAHRYPAQLVLQDVLTLHGRQLKDARCIVASSPCQAYSYMAMPWTRAKQIAKALRGEGEFPEGYNGYRTIAELNALFEAPKRIQREASEAAGRFIPMIQENVRGAIPWVGRSQWNFGSYHLWGDVPALMPMTFRGAKTVGHVNKRDGHSHARHLTNQSEHDGVKLGGGAHWAHPSDPKHQPGLDFTRLSGAAHTAQKLRERERERERERGSKDFTPQGQPLGKNTLAWSGSKSLARKQASAMIARIPLALASHIAHAYHPRVTA